MIDRPDASSTTPLLRALVVDDETPAREEVAYLLREDPRIATVRSAESAGHALRLLTEDPVDVIFCDLKMPGLDGVELARVISRFAERPHIVFVTAYDDRAVDAFDLGAVDYVMKPVSAERLAETVRRVASAGAEPVEDDETIPVELAGVTRFVRRSQVLWVEAQGDYVRLHTGSVQHLVRATLADLEERWATAGFVRIHRSTLVALDRIDEVCSSDGHYTVRIGHVELPVSRRHTRALRDRLLHR
ncbi:MAG: LytTR family DNA-binding domain-containing protein [Jatrophihabitans sp.]